MTLRGVWERIRSVLPATKHDLDKLEERLMTRMKTLDDLLEEVHAEKTVVESLITLTGGIKARLDEALKGGITPAQQAKIDAIFADVTAAKDEAAAAIVANTPADGN